MALTSVLDEKADDFVIEITPDVRRVRQPFIPIRRFSLNFGIVEDGFNVTN